MQRYRKKPVVVNAILFDWTNKMLNHLEYQGMEVLHAAYRQDQVTHLEIGTLEGSHVVSKGDYIIKGVSGEFYPCKPDIFHLTYDVEPIGG